MNGFASRLLAVQQPTAPTPVDVHLDLSGLADMIWRSLLNHLGDVAAAIWLGIRDHLGEIGQAIWTPLSQWLASGLQSAIRAIWENEAEDMLFGAAERNGVLADDGERQAWATIRSGLGAGMLEPSDLDAADANRSGG